MTFEEKMFLFLYSIKNVRELLIFLILLNDQISLPGLIAFTSGNIGQYERVLQLFVNQVMTSEILDLTLYLAICKKARVLKLRSFQKLITFENVFHCKIEVKI